jgi:hypothetical protein
MNTEKLFLIPYNLFQKIEKEGGLSNLLYETRITLLPKQHKDNIESKENYRPFPS